MSTLSSLQRLSAEGKEAFERKDYVSAAELWEQACPLYQALGDAVMAAAINQNLGVAYLNIGMLEKALERTDEARKFYIDHNLVVDVAETDQNRGNILVEMGKFAEAFELYDVARDVFRRNHVVAKVVELDRCIAVGHIKSGNVHNSKGLYKEAIDDFILARDIYLEYDNDVQRLDVTIAELHDLQLQDSMSGSDRQDKADILPERMPHHVALTLLWEQFQQDPRVGPDLIQLFEETVKYVVPAEQRILRATFLCDMGLVYAKSPIDGSDTGLLGAVECFQRAQQMVSPDDEPILCAHIQINLGEAYRNLQTGDREVNLANAITCARKALSYITLENEPTLFAMAENNLGAAYAALPSTDDKLNIVWAIECFKKAVRAYDPETTPLSYARSMSNLGNMYQRTGKTSQAIECYQEALKFISADTAPYEYAGIQTNLGISQGVLGSGDHEEDVRQSIVYHLDALRFYKPETTPYEYAGVQLNLGNAYRQLGDHEHAIEYYRNAMNFLNPGTFSIQSRQAGGNLGDLLFNAGLWSEAHAAYDIAIEAAENLYTSSFMDSSRRKETGEAISLYVNDAFCLARTGHITEGIIRLETGRTRILSERLARTSVELQQVSSEDREEFLRLVHLLKELETRQQEILLDSWQPATSGEVYTAMAEKVAQFRRELAVLGERISGQVPDFFPSLVEFDLISSLSLDDQTVLVLPCVTKVGSALFVIRSQTNPIVIWLDDFTESTLQHLMLEASDEVLAWFDLYDLAERQGFSGTRDQIMLEIVNSGGKYQAGWLASYRLLQITSNQAQATAHEAWLAAMDQVMAEIGKGLIAPLYAELQKYNPTQIVLIPHGSLFFLPLHAVPIDDNSVCLLDHYQVSYAPSIKVFQHCQNQAGHSHAGGLFAISNPTGDLDLAEIEVTNIEEYFKEDAVVLRHGDATKEKVLAQAGGYGYVHFSGHGKYDWDEPYRSALFLSGYQKNDGKESSPLQEQSTLTLAEVQAKMDLRQTRLITLSACETGMSQAMGYRAEEFVGLPAGFLLAGVSGVVSSLWPVPALATAILMERFYRNHRDAQMDVASALREAQMWVRDIKAGDVAEFADYCYRRTDQNRAVMLQHRNHYLHQAENEPTAKPFRNPYFWAAFTLNGV